MVTEWVLLSAPGMSSVPGNVSGSRMGSGDVSASGVLPNAMQQPDKKCLCGDNCKCGDVCKCANCASSDDEEINEKRLLEKYGFVEPTDEEWNSLNEDEKQTQNNNLLKIGRELERLNDKLNTKFNYLDTKIDNLDKKFTKVITNLVSVNKLKTK